MRGRGATARGGLFLALCATIPALLYAGAVPAAASGPAITLSPDAGTEGTTSTIGGSAFEAGMSLDFYWDEQQIVASIEGYQQSGSFSVPFVVPSDAGAGAHYVGARYRGQTSDAARAEFDVSQASPQASPSPSSSPQGGGGSGAPPPASPPPQTTSGGSSSHPDPVPAPAPGTGPAPSPAGGGGGQPGPGGYRVVYIDESTAAPRAAPGSSGSSPPAAGATTADVMGTFSVPADNSGDGTDQTVPVPAIALPAAGQIRLTDVVYKVWMTSSTFGPDSPFRFVQGLTEWAEGLQARTPYDRALEDLTLANRRLHDAQISQGRPRTEAEMLRQFSDDMRSFEADYGDVVGPEQATLRVVAGDSSVRQSLTLSRLAGRRAPGPVATALAGAVHEAGRFALATPPDTLNLLPAH